MYPNYPGSLNKGEFAVVRFSLELLESGTLELGHLLGMRRILRRCVGEVLGTSALVLFDPPLSCDPAALRRFQKPAPGFVLLPDRACVGELVDGDRIELAILFLGDAIRAIADFPPVFQQLGKNGLADGALRFEVVEVRTMSADGSWRRIKHAFQGSANFSPDLICLDQWLDRSWPEELPVILEFTTPMRLSAGGKILRRPRFDQIFPFLLRRVTAMLHAHCALEPVDDPLPLIRAASKVAAVWDTVHWVDWRETGDKEWFGGVTGTLLLAGPELEEVLWVVLLASLFGAGKGAAYGAGQCKLFPAGELAGRLTSDIIYS